MFNSIFNFSFLSKANQNINSIIKIIRLGTLQVNILSINVFELGWNLISSTVDYLGITLTNFPNKLVQAKQTCTLVEWNGDAVKCMENKKHTYNIST